MSEQFDELIKQSHGANWQWEFLMSESFVSFFDLIPEAGILSNEAGEVILANETAQRVFGYSQDEMLNKTIEDLVPPSIKKEHVKLRQWFFENPKPRFLESRSLDLQACKKNGELFPMESSLFAIHTNKGMIAVNLIRDISQQKADQEAITQFAFVDSLTNLPNTRYFQTNLKHNAARAKRHKESLGVLFVDLDHFKPINDIQGHQVGDSVLQQVAALLLKSVREEDLLARVGGDEFVVMVYPAQNMTMLERAAERLLAVCRQPITVEEQTFQISASIGIAISSEGDFDAQELVHVADKAMYQAKAKGGDCFVCADD